MIKVEATQQFTLARFNEISNLQRKGQEAPNTIFVGDTFECSEDLVKYLTGNNAKNVIVVKVIEVIPEKIIEKKVAEKSVVEEPAAEVKSKPIIKSSKKKSSKR